MGRLSSFRDAREEEEQEARPQRGQADLLQLYERGEGLMIDFSKYNFWFEDYCKEYNKVFNTQKEADEFYAIWIEGFNWSSYVYY